MKARLSQRSQPVYLGDDPGSQNAERSKSDDVCCGSRALMVRDARPLPLRATVALLTMRVRDGRLLP